jgi:hypothetical protein
MKKCPTFLASREMKINTTLRFNLTLSRIATIKKTNNNKCWQEYSGKKNLYTVLVGM